MATYYLDTSALVKCYVPEKGTAWVLALVTQNQTATTSITVAEGSAAIAKRQRLGEVTLDERNILFNRFLNDCKSRYDLLPVDEPVIYRAAGLTQIYPLRGYDAVHLATALVLRDQLVAARLPAPIFVAADANLCAVARAEGLAAENPNDYP
jgi:predicted nucleic acid-binding protein